MTAIDHNRTLVVLYSLLTGIFTLALIGSPWIIAKNVKNLEQIPLAIVMGSGVVLLAVLFLTTALALQRKKPLARKLAILVSVVLLPLCWPVGVYTWWFMHSEGGKRLYPPNVM